MMMRSLRKTLLLVIVVGAFFAAGLIESFNYLAAKHRSQITQELQRVLGNDVSFESFEVNLWGRPGFVATEFRIADDNRFAATPALRARELILGVSLWSLLRGRLVITSLSLHQPDFQIITDEQGRVNLTVLIERKTELRKFPRLRAGGADRNGLPISFAVDELAVTQGQIDYIDRSVRQPAELQIRNISMRIDGFQPDRPTRIHMGASLTPSLLQDVRIRGEIAGATEGGTWLQRAVDLNVQIDSLHVPVVARAIAVLRDRIPSELDVTGPMALAMTARGTFAQPRLEDITLKVPLFGSSEYNAIIHGRIQFTERRSWEEAELSGTLLVDPLSPNRLRSFAVFERLIPESVSTDGSVRITSRFEGTWDQLRIGALVIGDKIDVRYKNWLHKPAQTPATIRARMTKSKQRFIVHPSELDIGAQRLNFAGRVEYRSAPSLQLSMAATGAALASWTRFVGVPGFHTTAGKADLDITARKDLSAPDAPWDLHGLVKLEGAVLRHTGSGRSLDDLQGEIVFEGASARLQNGRARLGKSTILVEGGIPELSQPRFKTVFRAEHLDLRDLPGLMVGPAARLRAVSGHAEVALEDNGWLLTGSVTAPEASVNSWPLRAVRGNVEWDSTGLKLSDVQAQAFQGVLRGEGFLPGAAGQTRPFVVSGQVENMDLRSILVHWFPPFRDRVEGRFSGDGQFETAGPDAAGRDTFAGGGQAEIRHGMIRNFNLVSQLLLKGSDSGTPPSSFSRIPPGFTALLQRRDTSIDSVKADFRVEQDRLFSDNLVITTADYTITGAGWVRSDRSMRWNAMLVLSPRLTHEFQREYRGLRYVVDRRGRLALEFRVDGQIPSPSIRLENRALAQALGFGSGSKGGEGAGGNSSKPRKNWIPDALERYLNR